MRHSTSIPFFLSALMIFLLFSCEGTNPGSENNGNDTEEGQSSSADSDGTTGDLCPDDPDKTEPGVCGCGVEEGQCDDDGETDGDECQAQAYDTTKEDFADQFCCLCKDCRFGPSERNGLIVDTNGRTCSELSLDLANPDNASGPGSETCHEMQNQYRDVCCNSECTPPQVDVDWKPVEAPFDQGDQPVCHVCYPGDEPNGQFPLKPFTITAVLYIPGNPTCEDLYWMGRTGNIPDALCYPMQDYMEEPCGCSVPSEQEYPKGSEPWCDLCPRGQYPLRPGTELRELDLPGHPSCKDLYWMGRTGAIAEPLCQQMQEDLQEPCGCLP